MKKNYLLSALLSIVTLGAWANGGTNFGSAVAVTAGTDVSITYPVATADQYGEVTYEKQWYKYTATADGGEYVFIEDAVNLQMESMGTLLTSWPSNVWGSDVIRGDVYDTSTKGTGTYLYVKMAKNQTITFYLAAPGNRDTENANGTLVPASPVTSKFRVNTFRCTDYPGGESEETPIVLAKNTNRLIFPSGDNDVWVKITPDQSGKASFQCPFGMIYQINVVDSDGMSKRYLEDNDNDSDVYTIFRFMVEAGKSYFVSFGADRRMNVQWSLQAIAPGEDCMLPKEITAGENDVKIGATYYKYKATKDCYLELESALVGSSAIVFNSCNSQNEQNSISAKTGFYLKRKVAKDETVIITMQGSSVGKFTLKETDAKAGWDAEHVLATAELNQKVSFTLGSHADTYWFKFVAPNSATDKEFKICPANKANRPPVSLAVYDKNELRITAVTVSDSLDIRLDAGETYYITWAADDYYYENGKLSYDNPATVEFIVTEVDIIDGRYCDRPLIIDFKGGSSTNFVMGTENGIPAFGYDGADSGCAYYYKFVAPDDGYVSFITLNKEWSQLWSVSYKEGCDDIEHQLKAQNPSAQVTYGAKYVIPVIKGHTYLWTPFVYKTKSKVSISVNFINAAPGEACSKPLSLDLNEEMPMSNETLAVYTWVGANANKAGEYIISANAGETGYIDYKVGDCDVKSVRAAKDYGTGVSSAKIYVKEPTQILVYYYYDSYQANVDDRAKGFVKVEYTGDNVLEGLYPEKPINVIQNQEYTIMKRADNISDVWYSYSAVGGQIIVKVVSNFAFASMDVYSQSDLTTVIKRVSSYDGVEDKATGKYTVTLVFDANKVKDTYLLNFGYVPENTKFSIKEDVTAIAVNKAASISIYPNPNNGEFTVALGDLSIEGATVEVTSLGGNVVYKEFVSGENASINLRGVAAGAYLVKVANAETAVVSKVIIR